MLSVRAEHPAWGGRKIARRLKDLGHEAVPAPSTVTAILKRHGVELGAHGGGQSAFTRFERARPNELWQMDFKGHVALHAGRLHPLTVLDDHSRFALVLAACTNEQTETVRQQLIIAFRRYGLPERLITDNGSPWGDGPGSPFTPLGVWLIEHGIRISHSRPYHPQTMGKDERFHRSLKAEVLSGPPFADLAAAERAFERWRNVYNTQRPHEALKLNVPASRYQPSPRDYVETIAPFEYAPRDIVRHVQQGGHVSLLGRNVKVPKAFRGKADRVPANHTGWRLRSRLPYPDDCNHRHPATRLHARKCPRCLRTPVHLVPGLNSFWERVAPHEVRRRVRGLFPRIETPHPAAFGCHLLPQGKKGREPITAHGRTARPQSR